jgi:tellurium resistance protein TerD
MSDNKLLRMLRGEEVNLHEIDPGLHRVHVGLGWTAPEQALGVPVDLDACAFLLGRENRVRRNSDFVFYNNLETDNGVIKHLGDNLTGGKVEAGGDCETIEIDLDGIHFEIEKIVFTVTIHNSEERQQHFGIVTDAYMRIVNMETKVELARFDLKQTAANEDAFIFGEIYRIGMGWRFKAIGQGITGGLYKVARDFQVNVAPL